MLKSSIVIVLNNFHSSAMLYSGVMSFLLYFDMSTQLFLHYISCIFLQFFCGCTCNLLNICLPSCSSRFLEVA